MKRRSLLKAAGALAVPATTGLTLGAPSIAAAQSSRVLKFVPQSDLAVLDPMWTTAYVTRNHGAMVFDTLYGQTGPASNFKVTPQMVAGHTIDNDGKLWKLTLRDGLKFHDGTPVLAKDCVASIKRWGVRDAFGQALLSRTDELSAPDDKTIQFKLKKPFPLLPDALGKSAVSICAIMPERLAKTDPFTQVSEMVGSGPFKFVAKERVPGSLLVYEKFGDYVPVPTGKAEWMSGPKVVHYDRVEWHVISEAATAANALKSGEVDWWEQPTADLLPMLKADKNLRAYVQDPTGYIATMRPNHLLPPFDNPAIRRALLGAIDQTEAMTAVNGDDTSLWKVPLGVFPSTSPLANDTDMGLLTSKRDYAAVKKALAEAGYKGEKVALMAASDFPILKAMADVAQDFLVKSGMNVDYQSTDWGTVVQRRAKKDPVDKGGWNVFCTGFGALDVATPAGFLALRGNGPNAWFGWPTSPKIEEMRDAWFDAPDLASQKKIASDIQHQFFQDVPYWPLGVYYSPTAYNKKLTGVLDGFAMFWNVKPA